MTTSAEVIERLARQDERAKVMLRWLISDIEASGDKMTATEISTRLSEILRAIKEY